MRTSSTFIINGEVRYGMLTPKAPSVFWQTPALFQQQDTYKLGSILKKEILKFARSSQFGSIRAVLGYVQTWDLPKEINPAQRLAR